MTAIRIILTAVFLLFSAIGVFNVLSGLLHPLALIIVCLYAGTVLALYKKGGRFFKYIGYFTGGLLSLMSLAVVVAVVQPFLGAKFEIVLFVASLVLSILGIMTIYCLRKLKVEN